MTAPHGLSLAQTTALTGKATLLAVATAAVLVAIKAGAWLASGSTAVLASLADSGLDLVASLVTFFAVRYAAAPPDAEHRYGHGKAEAFASLMQAGLVFASAALVAREAVGDLLDPRPLRQEGWAMAVMTVSMVLTFALITVQTRVLRQASSAAVAGDRAHYASDLASNFAALVGIAGSAWLGLNAFDAVAALVVAALLLWGAVSVFREAANQLMDRELPDAERAEILALVTADARLGGVHHFRTRASGPYVHVQMHVDLDPGLTLEAAQKLIVEAEKRVLARFPLADVIIHADPRGGGEPDVGVFADVDPGQ